MSTRSWAATAHRTGTASTSASMPARWGLLRWVVRVRAVLDADARRPCITKDGPPTGTPSRPWHVASAPQFTRVAARSGRRVFLGLVVTMSALPASASAPAQPSCVEAEPAKISFRGGRPMRPSAVVHPGGGAAAPRASWPQPSGENNFPCAARIPRQTNSFPLPVLLYVAAAARCGPPVPRRPDHNKDA